MTAPASPPQAVVLFDGVCNLCNGVVQFIIPLDADGQFRFASQQSGAGQKLLAEHGLPGMATVVLIGDGRVFTKSDAVLEIARRLGTPWSLLHAFRFLPRSLRDAVYDLIARYRYRIFGRRESCWLPTPELRARFLDIA